MAEKNLSGIQAGVSGEYFVAAELSRRGYSCSITIKNTKGVDILVSSVNSKKLIGIQVKTNQDDKKAWMLNEKAEQFAGENLFYVLTANVGKLNSSPDYYIVPSGKIASRIREEHQIWLKTLGAKGQTRNDTSIRQFRDEKQEYKDRWDYIEDSLKDT